MTSNWIFKTTQISARKTKEYGTPYSGIAHITIVDGIPYIEGLLVMDEFTTEDYLEIREYLKGLGFKEYIFSRYKNGKKITKKYNIGE